MTHPGLTLEPLCFSSILSCKGESDVCLVLASGTTDMTCFPSVSWMSSRTEAHYFAAEDLREINASETGIQVSSTERMFPRFHNMLSFY